MDNGIDGRPVQVIRDQEQASIAASIWLRQTKAGVFYDISFARAYPKSESEVGYSETFGDRHLDALIRVIRIAQAWIAEKKANAAICRGSEGDDEDYYFADEAA